MNSVITGILNSKCVVFPGNEPIMSIGKKHCIGELHEGMFFLSDIEFCYAIEQCIGVKLQAMDNEHVIIDDFPNYCIAEGSSFTETAAAYFYLRKKWIVLHASKWGFDYFLYEGNEPSHEHKHAKYACIVVNSNDGGILVRDMEAAQRVANSIKKKLLIVSVDCSIEDSDRTSESNSREDAEYVRIGGRRCLVHLHEVKRVK